MKIAVFTRSCNMEYYSKMVSLLPNDVECHRMTGYNHWSDASHRDRPGQGGDGHVNELPNEDVIALFPEYDYDIETSLYLRSKATIWWFKNTIMVFKRK